MFLNNTEINSGILVLAVLANYIFTLVMRLIKLIDVIL